MNGNGENISGDFKTKYSELTDWICRERERAEPDIKLWFSARGWADEVPFKGTRKSEEASTVDSKTMRVGKGVRGSTPSALRSGRGDNFTVAIHDSTTADSNNHRSCSIYFKNRHTSTPAVQTCSCSRIIIDSMQDYQFYFGQKVLLEFGKNW